MPAILKYDEALKNAFMEKEIDDVSIIEDNQEINQNCGLEPIVITDDHINALKEGKALWFDIMLGEYAGLIVYKGENKTK